MVDLPSVVKIAVLLGYLISLVPASIRSIGASCREISNLGKALIFSTINSVILKMVVMRTKATKKSSEVLMIIEGIGAFLFLDDFFAVRELAVRFWCFIAIF